MRTGVRQGFPLSFLHFLVVLDWVTRTAFARKCSIEWSFMTPLEDLQFADDLALMSQNTGHKGQDTTFGGTGCEGGLEDQCYKDEAYAYCYQTW